MPARFKLAISYQRSVISDQLSAISCQHSAVNIQLSALSLLVVLAILLVFPKLALAQESTVQSSTNLQTGVQVFGGGDLLKLAGSQVPSDWVKIQYAPGQVAQVSSFVRAAKALGKKVMVSIAKNVAGITLDDNFPTTDACPDGASNGYATYRQFMQKTAADFGANVDAYEIMNEPNLSGEWGSALGTFSAQKYGRLLECGAKGIKAGRSQAMVISGGFSPIQASENDIFQLGRLFPGGSSYMLDLTNIDYIGLHLYSNQNIPPSDASSQINYLKKLTQAVDTGKKYWITEFGWQRCDAKITPAEQIKFINQSLDLISQQYPNVAGVIIWNFGGLALGQEDFGCYDIAGGIAPKPVADDVYTKALNNRDQPTIIVSDDGNGVKVEYFGKDLGKNCPNPTTAPTVGDRENITAPSWDNDSNMSRTLSSVLLPADINQDVSDTAKKQNLTQTGADKDFGTQLACGLKKILNITDPACAENVKIGNSTQELALRSQALALSYMPSSMEYKPVWNDCNVFDLAPNNNTRGNEDVNKVQAFWGGLNQSRVAELADHDLLVQKCMEKLNLKVGDKQLTEDRRVCETEANIKEMKQANFPDGINPYGEVDKDAKQVLERSSN